ncbi:uncharacterized protein LOC121730568 isoform X3 [Aricia agestis]|uniref:uncharacterized protein LOC121730568 isoform X3 n=1 Tax=Aricia agestis TaxID=91739 RepID=UPI001C20A151|nr:uncharacterized protein LOC121730568 isoform X3 [Aricia agestis]
MHVEFNKFITAILTIFKLHQTAIMGEGIIIFALWYAFLGYMYYRRQLPFQENAPEIRSILRPPTQLAVTSEPSQPCSCRPQNRCYRMETSG